MPRLSFRVSEGTKERLEKLSAERKDKTLTETITYLIEEHFGAQLAPNWRPNGAQMTYKPESPRVRASPFLSGKKNNIERGDDSDSDHDPQPDKGEKKHGKGGKNGVKKKPPPPKPKIPIPENWEPPEHMRAEYCAGKGLDYEDALDLFTDAAKASDLRYVCWKSAWSTWLRRGKK